MSTGVGSARHGYVAYTQGCRCEVCRAAKAAYMRERRAAAAAVRERVEARPGRNYVAGIRHGIAGYQDYHCRCRQCRAAKAAERQRRVSS